MQNKQRNISIKRTDDIGQYVDFLTKKLSINTTSVVRMSLKKLYDQERAEC